jgi:hypothetical protein
VLIAEVLNNTGTLSDQSNWWIGEVIVPLMGELVAGAISNSASAGNGWAFLIRSLRE